MADQEEPRYTRGEWIWLERREQCATENHPPTVPQIVHGKVLWHTCRCGEVCWWPFPTGTDPRPRGDRPHTYAGRQPTRDDPGDCNLCHRSYGDVIHGALKPPTVHVSATCYACGETRTVGVGGVFVPHPIDLHSADGSLCPGSGKPLVQSRGPV